MEYGHKTNVGRRKKFNIHMGGRVVGDTEGRSNMEGGGGLNTDGGEMFPGGRKNNVWGPFRLPAYQHWHSYWELHTDGPWTFPSHIVNMGPEPSPVPHIPPPHIEQGPWTFPCTTHAPRIKHGSWTFPCTTHPPYKNLGPGPSPVPQISL